MWKVLSDRLSDKIHFGFIKDTKGEAAKSIGMGSQDKKVDAVKVVTWTADGERNIYGGEGKAHIGSFDVAVLILLLQPTFPMQPDHSNLSPCYSTLLSS